MFETGGIVRGGRRSRPTRVSDIRTLVAALGGDAAVVALYDARFGITITGSGVSGWADARGASGFGPTIVQGTDAARPSYSASERAVTFDGSDDFLRATSAAALTSIADSCALVLVAQLAAQDASARSMCYLSNSSSPAALAWLHSTTFQLRTQTPVLVNPTFPGSSDVRVLHGRRTQAAGDVVIGARMGSGAESTTGPSAEAAVSPDRLTLGANNAGTAGAFTPITAARALLVVKGDYTAAMAAAVNQWALAVHRAVLA